MTIELSVVYKFLRFQARLPLSLALLYLLCCPSIVFAQPARVIKDINPGISWVHGSSPHAFVEFQGFAYFIASEFPNRPGLWRSDGTEPGTELIFDGVDTKEFLVVGQTLFFVASTSANEADLWKSDGTPEGTRRVKQLREDKDRVIRSALIEFAGTIYFAANDGVTGTELWRSDGTEAGTTQVRDIHPDGSSAPSGLVATDTAIYFAANDGVRGTELWRSDGSAAGTTMVRDINPGPDGSTPRRIVDLNGQLVFSADDGLHGREPWRSNGTPAGTALIRDVNGGPEASIDDEFDETSMPFNGSVFFAARALHEFDLSLWKTDGSAAGTILVKSNTRAMSFTQFQGALYFLHDDIYIRRSQHLWRTDGSPDGTESVAFVAQGIAPALTVAGDRLFFAHENFATGGLLWKTDGNVNTATLVKSIPPVGTSEAFPQELTAIDSTVYFSAVDTGTFHEFWKSDGSESGTVLVKDIGRTGEASYLAGIARLGSDLIFLANDGITGNAVWKSSGTEQGTQFVKTVTPPESEAYFVAKPVVVDGVAYFTADDGTHGLELWRSDGTPEGTHLLKDITPPTTLLETYPNRFGGLGNHVYFGANDGVVGMELWRSDGTEVGTVLFADLNPNSSEGSSPRLFTNVGGKLLFLADDPSRNVGLWSTDGSVDGTELLSTISGSLARRIRHLVECSGRLYFRIFSRPSNVTQIWSSNGEKFGTMPLKTFDYEEISSSQSNLACVSGTMFFSAEQSVWKTDGTIAGTTQVRGIGSPIGAFVGTETTLFFVVSQDIAGTSTDSLKIWKSDGTETGTVPLRKVNSIGEGGDAIGLGTNNGASFLSVPVGDGHQLWSSHGTVETTRPVSGVFPGPVRDFAALGPLSVVAAFGPETGLELHAIPMLPVIASGGVVDAASYRPLLAPGALASIFGAEFVSENHYSPSIPLRTRLETTTVRVNGRAAPLLFASPSQINFQVPFEATEGSDVPLTVVVDGEESVATKVAISTFAPSVFVNPNSDEPVVARHPNGGLISTSNPVRAGDVLTIYLTGIGGIDADRPVSGAGSPSSPLATASSRPTVTIGGVGATVLFAGLTPGFVGLAQINIQLPDELPSGKSLALVIRFGQNQSQLLFLSR